MPPAPIVQWINQAYPKPKVDPEWLEACYAWINDELQLDPATQMDEIISNVERQLLESDLRDSMLRGTGLPANVTDLNSVKLRGPPVLVEVTAMTEIGQSAFSLQNVRQTRVDRADLAGLGGDNAAEEDEGPVPRYPRTMLRFELSDGSVTLPAIEYRSLPEFVLGETPLGYKMLLKDVQIRRGVAFLEPQCVVLKGHMTEERETMQDADFVRSLRRRLGKPDLEPEEADLAPAAPPPGPPPGGPPAPLAQVAARSPLRELSEPPQPPVHQRRGGTDYGDDEDLPRKRRIPSPPAPTPASSSTFGVSPYFSGTDSFPSTGRTLVDQSQRFSRILSPARGEPIVIEDSSMEFENEPPRFGAARSLAAASIAKTKGKGKSTASVHASSDFDYGDDNDMMDDAFLAEITQAEKAAIEAETSASQAANKNTSGLGARSLGPVALGDVIMIDDDEEEDKENMPTTTRRVRRRVGLEQLPGSDVIELSD